MVGEGEVQGVRSAGGPHATFHAGAVFSLAAAHFVHDTYPGFLGVLLPILIDRFGLSLAMAGLIASVMSLSSVTQPALGYIIDRTDARRWVIVTPAATAVFMSLLGVAPSPEVALILLLGAGLSIAAFHPAAGSLVTQLAEGQWGKATSWFMTGGPLGSAIGPLYIAAVVQVGTVGLSWVAAVPGVVYSAVLALVLGRVGSRITFRPPAPIRAALGRQRRPIALLGLSVVLQSLAMVGFVTFYPTFAVASGQGLLDAGVAITLYQGGGALGALASGWLSDRFGRRTMLLVSQVGGIPSLLGAVALGASVLHFPLLALGGAFLVGAAPVQLVLMQELLPENRSTAAGMMFFLSIGASSLASVFVGLLGDVVGLEQALILGVVGGAAALPFLLVLPTGRRLAHDRLPLA